MLRGVVCCNLSFTTKLFIVIILDTSQYKIYKIFHFSFRCIIMLPVFLDLRAHGTFVKKIKNAGESAIYLVENSTDTGSPIVSWRWFPLPNLPRIFSINI